MSEPSTARPGPLLFVIGAAGVVVSILASLMLVISHFAAMALPGCAPGSACALLTEGPWGKIPGVGMPVSLVGLAWFVAALAGWIAAWRSGPAAPFLWLIRIGALASLFFCIVMARKGHLCPYCAAAHGGNFLFWIVAERTHRAGAAAAVQFATVVIAFLVALGGLWGVEVGRSALIRARDAREREESTKKILAGGEDLNRPFTGRYRLGAVQAPVRIVVISDYMCPNCANIEAEVRAILAVREDVSFSAKHYPMCSECNEFINDCTVHPNSCKAARASEAAGLLRGAEGFWAMHHWLFDRRGEFGDGDLEGFVTAQGYDLAEFRRVMEGADTLKLIQADIREAKAIGLFSTPMIFVNGVELKGFRQQGTLTETVRQVAAAGPSGTSADGDRPPPAAEKFVDDWRTAVRRSAIPGPDKTWTRGAESPRARLVLWGDLTDADTIELHTSIAQTMAARGDLQYSFMHFPLSRKCNPSTKRDDNPQACLAARAAEAAGQINGTEGYWAMQDWLVAHAADLSEESIGAAAVEMGMLADKFRRALNSREASTAVAEDIRLAVACGINTTMMPALFVNERQVPRWKLEGHDILAIIVEEAAKQGLPPPPPQRPRR